MSDHDGAYKLLFSHPRMVLDLLRGFVAEPWVGRLDPATLEKVNPAYVSDELRHREDDLVWRLRLHGDDWLYVYLLLEMQSRNDRHMAVRALAYVALLYQDLLRQPERLPAGRLPPVVPLVLYNGGPSWSAPTRLRPLLAEAPALRHHAPEFGYLLVETRHPATAGLAAEGNLVAAVFHLEQSRSLAEVRDRLDALGVQLRQAAGEDLRRAFASWLRRVLLPARLPGMNIPELADFEECKLMLAETILELTEKLKTEALAAGRPEGRTRGRAEGEATGRLLGERRLLARQLQLRFGALEATVQARIEAAGEEELLCWGERLLTASELGEVFAP